MIIRITEKILRSDPHADLVRTTIWLFWFIPIFVKEEVNFNDGFAQ